MNFRKNRFLRIILKIMYPGACNGLLLNVDTGIGILIAHNGISKCANVSP